MTGAIVAAYPSLKKAVGAFVGYRTRPPASIQEQGWRKWRGTLLGPKAALGPFKAHEVSLPYPWRRNSKAVRQSSGDVP